MRAITSSAVAFVCIVVAIAAPASAGVIQPEILLDSMHGNHYTDQTTPAFYIHNFSIDDKRQAVRFSIPATSAYQFDVLQILVAARWNSSQTLKVSLHADQSNLPGAQLSSQLLTNLPIRADGAGAVTFVPQSVTFPGAPQLQPGANYWVAVSTPDFGSLTDIYWWTNLADMTGPTASFSSLNWTTWQFHPTGTLPRMTLSATPIPEPAAAMLLMGAVALATRRRDRR